MWRMRGRWKRSQASGFPGHTAGGNLPASSGDVGLILGLGRSTHHGATKPMHNYWSQALEPASHNYWARAPRACGHSKRSHRSESPTRCSEEQPPPPTTRESPVHSKEDLAQPKHLLIFKKPVLFLLCMGFSRQECWSGLPFPSPVDHVSSDLSILGGPTQHGSSFHWVLQGCGPSDWFG